MFTCLPEIDGDLLNTWRIHFLALISVCVYSHVVDLTDKTCVSTGSTGSRRTAFSLYLSVQILLYSY